MTLESKIIFQIHFCPVSSLDSLTTPSNLKEYLEACHDQIAVQP